MKAISAALLLLAVLAVAEARPTMRVLNKKSSASASATAVAKDGGKASADATAAAVDGGVADADSTAYAAGEGAVADSSATAYAYDWGYADADSTAKALGKGAYADSDATAYADGEVTAVADSKAIAYGDATATADASAYASGDGDAKSTAYAVAVGEDDGYGHYGYKEDPYYKYYDYYGYYPKDGKKDDGYGHYYGYHEDPYYKYYGYYGYYPKDGEKDNGYGHYYGYHKEPYYKYYGYYGYYPKDGDDDYDATIYDPYHYYYHGYHGYKTADPEEKYPYYGKYVVVEKEAKEEELTAVKYVDPTILAYYAQKVYDYGCYEGWYYKCTYDESCGACPYGYFCGEKSEEVCEDVEVWVKNCDPKPIKRCVPDLSPCGTGFCKYSEKCAADYYWCGAKWCTPKYSCVAVETPKKCVWELKDGQKVQSCTDYAPEACVAGQDPCAIGYKCSEDPCTMVKSTVKKCGTKTVPVCVAFDVPIYKTLFKECGPDYCHPGYKCESFEHDSCAVKVVHDPAYYGEHHDYHDSYEYHDYHDYHDYKDYKDYHAYHTDDPYAVDPYSYIKYDDDDGHVDPSKPYVPCVTCYGDGDKKDSASVTATATSKSTPYGVSTYSNVDAYATGDGVATGWAGAKAKNGKGDTAYSGSDATASKDKTTADTITKVTGYGVAAGDATGTYEEDK